MLNKTPRFFCASQGFTLVEVLVALVITTLLVSILMGSLYYVFQVQDSLRAEIVNREHELRSQAWFRDVLAGCLPADLESGAQFVGSAQTISCDTNAPLRPQAIQGTERVTLTLRKNKNNENEVTYQEQSSQKNNSKAPEPTVILVLPSGDAGFRYLGVTGSGAAENTGELGDMTYTSSFNTNQTLDDQEVDHWPRNANDLETIPRRIRLSIKNDTHEQEQLVAVRATPWLEPVIKNPFGFDIER